MRNCPTCQTPNRVGANFCKHCGNLVASNCPRCQAIVQEHANYCDTCALPFRTSLQPNSLAPAPATAPPPKKTIPAATTPTQLDQLIPQEFANKLQQARDTNAMAGERRIVTMLFCDVKGSTAAAEQLDPEEWSEIINEAFEYMIRPVYQFEGTVARLMGDAILAFFGAPIAHEDDPERAILAGLEIVKQFEPYRQQVLQQWDIDFNVRVGINTGLVMVGQVGSDLQMEYTALGDAINLAARMEQTAVPGTVLVSENTYKRVAPVFEFEDLGAVTVKGKTQPIAVYRPLQRKRERGRLRGIEGLDAPMIGRAREWEKLLKAAESVARGVGQIAFLVGEAGLGKSRLISELKLHFEEDEQVQIFESASLSYETTLPYGFFQRLVRHVIGASANDAPEVLRELIRDVVTNFAEPDSTQKAIESLFGMSGLDGSPPLEGDNFKNQLFKTVSDIWRQRAAFKPSIYICDDIHWTDPASIELLEHLLPLTNESPLMILCAQRPERSAPGWELMQNAERDFAHRFTEIKVLPLTEADSNKLVDSLLTISDFPPSFRKRILERSEGNPFFVEEVVRTLIDSEAVLRDESGTRWIAQSDGADIDIPDNIQSLLTARIDRLEDEVRRTLQMAALIGRSFYYRILKIISPETSEETLPEHLTALQKMDLIREAARQPELEYIFRHALTQEAAYGTILLKQRRQYHQRVAEAMLTIFQENVDEHAAILAYHFNEAGNHQEAIRFYTVAGDAAVRLSAYREAVVHYSKAIACFESLGEFAPDPLIYLHTSLGRSLEVLYRFEEADQVYLDLLALAEKHQNDQLELAARFGRTIIRVTFTPMFDPTIGEQFANETLALAEKLGDGKSQARIYWAMMLVEGFAKVNYPAATANGEKALALARTHQDEKQTSLIINDLGRMYCFKGDFDRGMPLIQEAKERFTAENNLPMLSDNYNGMSLMLYLKGDVQAALETAIENHRMSVSIENTFGIRDGLWRINTSRTELGYFDQCIPSFEELITDYGFGVDIIIAMAPTLGRCYAALGDIPKALAVMNNPLIEREKMGPLFSIPFYGALAEFYFEAGDLAQSEAALAMVSKELPLEEVAFYPFNAYFPIAKIGLLIAQNNLAEAIEFGENTLGIMDARGQTYQLAELAYRLAQAYLKKGERESAKAFLLRGAAVTDQHQLHPMRWKIHSLLAHLTEDEPHRQKAEESIDFLREHTPTPELTASFLTYVKSTEALHAQLSQ